MKHPLALEVYDLYNRFLEEFILNGRSILTKDKLKCLNPTTLSNCQRVYVEGADFSKDESFGKKLAKQFLNEDYPTRLVMAHLEWLWALGTMDLKIETKRSLTERTLGDKVAASELEDVYLEGFGKCGTYHQRSKNKEIEFILLLVKYLYEQRLHDEFKVYEDVASMIERICLQKKYGGEPKNYGLETGIAYKDGQAMVNVLLHLSHPDTYERIASGDHKQKIATAFSEFVNTDKTNENNRIFFSDNQEVNLDDKLFQIRNKLGTELGNPNFDFYDKDIAAKWNKNGDKTTTPTPSVSDSNLTQNDDKKMPTFPLNQILYGPPGTGKTYHTINKALEIVGFDATDKTRKELKDEFDERIKTGQIVFTTFHQSMSYEDFIEGIKPIEPENEGDIMIYKVVDGIFKRIKTDACFAIAQQKMPKKTKEVIDFSTQYDNYIGSVDELLLQGKTVRVGTRSKAEIFIDGISPNRNITVKHSEGVRTYIVSKDRLTKLNQAFAELNDVTNIDAQFREVIGGSNASAYWAILNAIRKTPSTDKVEIQKTYTYEEKKTVVASMLKSDFEYKATDKQAQPYVLIIDEINRGNVSQIFGELITLIEEDKRLGRDEALEVILPYSKTPFGVPPNVYIIGTMNTADRSVEALDTALRRRFSFEEMPPQYNLPQLDFEIEGFTLRKILTTINDRIEVLLNRDNLIGHSYFLKVDSEEALKDTIFKNILPLLQEYFFGDYGKIGLVMGKGFVKEEKERKKVSFSAFDYPDTEGVQKTIYELRKYEDVNIEDAIKLLLNEKEA